MLKGTTTIQLFNAETGEKEQEYKKSNIVTNALSNLVNPSAVLKSGSSNANDYEIRKNLANAYNSALGGLFLFNDFHGSDPEKVLPDASNKLIGFAGNETAITNDSRQGVRNMEESQKIENGYRLVWDFPTNKANGIIKSISLTSILAGNTGGGLMKVGVITDSSFKNYGNSSAVMLSYPFQGLPVSDTTSDYDGGVVFYIKPLTDGKLEMLYFSGGYLSNVGYADRCIYKLTYENPNAIKPLQGNPPYLLKKEKISDPIHSNTIYNWSVWVDLQKKVNITYKTSSSSSALSAIHKIYNLNGTLETEKTVTLPSGMYINSGIGFANGKYYCTKTDDNYNFNVVSFSDSGQIIATSDREALGYSIAFSFFINQNTGELLVNFSRGSSRYTVFDYSLIRIVDTGDLLDISAPCALPSYILTGDTYPSVSVNYILSTMPYIDGDIGIKPPYTPICYGRNPSASKNAALHFIKLSYYLGTINDLDTAITKTSAQTMKVIYELTEASQS